ncbi:amino acid ABC transporter substrate-binding protein, PAAT family [Quadrisphaera granulorum]|uniref:Amino acid ABC transporter substrate-binding protein (PAAT family) n=1 Tax=Quadrisphaera granulorum TaxID=317664 RepID=A0A316A8B9_9ACTN|nr:ABC transporter substrate-binding protein [Quadrisphaera granulorum]PWJ53873.1 amino acid ABC transporter substrate-binding protein (PAAT family) [Quadrisphaera granulorum]SZE96630.1 amino acid ABC transporter substrate-binding protein, PAAT family [Quadrisphaera granulorum]
MSRPTAPRRHRAVAGLFALSLVPALAACGGGDSSSSSAASGDCKPAHTFDTIDKGTLTVGVYDLPPFISTTGEGGMSGIDADLIREVAKLECLEVKPVNTSAAAMVPGVQNGRLDVGIGDWYRTKARAEIINLSDPLYLDDMAIVSKDGIDTVSGMEGKTVGTVDGYLWVEDLKKVLGDNLKLYPSGVNMQQDLKAGRIEVGIDSYGSAVETLKGDTTLKIEKAKPDSRVAASEQPAQTGFLLPKDNQAWVDAVNADIATLRENGTLAKVLTKNGLDASSADVGDPRLIG